MTALVHEGVPGLDGVHARSTALGKVGPDEVLIKLKAAGLNHRDLFIVARRSPNDTPLVLGSDGTGVIAAVGAAVELPLGLGDQVIINPTLGWTDPDDVPEVPDILGGPSDGTFAEFVAVPASNIAPKPSHLSWLEAAALPLSAVTAYRALFTRGGLRRGQHVLLPGIGSGVATIALAMAKAAGAVVTVTSRSDEKNHRALALGADHAVTTASEWSNELSTPVDLVIDSIGSATFDSCLAALRPGGRLVTLGATTGAEVSLSLRQLFFRQISVTGTSMGSAAEFQRMLEFVDQHRIRPLVHGTFPLVEGRGALAELARGNQFGKLVLTID